MPTRIKRTKTVSPAAYVPTNASSSPDMEDEDDFLQHLAAISNANTDNTQENTDDDDNQTSLDDDNDSYGDTASDTRNHHSSGNTLHASVSMDMVSNSAQDTLDQQNLSVEELQRKRKLPKVPSLRPSFADAIAWHKKLTPMQREHVIVYCYRTWPIIIRSGDSKYIDVIIEPFDKQTIENNHGGGKYSFYFLDTDLPKNNQLFTTSLEIDTNFKAPILDYTELDVTHQKNSKYVALLKRDGVLTMDGKVREQNPPASSDAVTMKLIDAVLAEKHNKQSSRDDNSTVIAKAMEMATQGFKTQIDSMRDQANRDSPEKMLGLVEKITQLAKPSNDNSALDMMRMMMDMQNKAHEKQMQLMEKQIEALNQRSAASDSSNSSDPMDQLEKIVSVAEKLGFSRRNPPPPPKDTVDKILEYAGPVVNGILGIIQQQMSLGNPNAGNVAMPPVTIPKAPELIDVEATPVSTQQPGANEMPQDATKRQQVEQLSTVLRSYGGLILGHMDGLDKTGDMFADALVGMFGMPTYNQVAQVGPEVLYETMRQVPEFWSKASLFGDPYVKKFCKDFCDYPRLLAEAEQAEDDAAEGLEEELAPQAKTKSKKVN
jgi:hypothetical protein